MPFFNSILKPKTIALVVGIYPLRTSPCLNFNWKGHLYNIRWNCLQDGLYHNFTSCLWQTFGAPRIDVKNL